MDYVKKNSIRPWPGRMQITCGCRYGRQKIRPAVPLLDGLRLPARADLAEL
jgi:hypothetical protein